MNSVLSTCFVLALSLIAGCCGPSAGAAPEASESPYDRLLTSAQTLQRSAGNPDEYERVVALRKAVEDAESEGYHVEFAVQMTDEYDAPVPLDSVVASGSDGLTVFVIVSVRLFERQEGGDRVLKGMFSVGFRSTSASSIRELHGQ